MTETVTTPHDADGYPEPCPKCRGKGVRWFGRGAPPVPCRMCEGVGVRVYKAPAAKRAHTREVAAARKAAKLAAAVDAFQQDYPRIWAWMERGQVEFARAMKAALLKWGGLTDRQLAASQKWAR